MLCVRSVDRGQITRVSNPIAHQLVRENKAAYIAKSLWKKEVRDFKPEPPPKLEKEPKPKKQKGGKKSEKSEHRRERHQSRRRGNAQKTKRKDR